MTTRRKRRYHSQMHDGSIDESLHDLDEILMNAELSPSTKSILEDMRHDLQDLSEHDSNSQFYARTQGKILRAEQTLGAIFATDRKYDTLYEKCSHLIEKGKILDFGDYHRVNLNHFKAVAKKLVDEKNRKVSKKEKEEKKKAGLPWKHENLLVKPWQLILEDLATEEKEMNAWVASDKKDAAPQLKLRKFLEDTGKRCSIPWTFKQIQFEMTEYSVRNQIAHKDFDSIIEKAKKDAQFWNVLAQQLLNDRQEIITNNGPQRISNQQAEMLQSLQIFESLFFKDLTWNIDPSGVFIPENVVVSDQYAPPTEEEDYKAMKQRVDQLEPADGWELDVKENYLRAYKLLSKAENEVEVANSEVVAANEWLSVCRGRYREARKNMVQPAAMVKKLEKDREETEGVATALAALDTVT